VWNDYRNNAIDLSDVYVQRMMPDGTVAPGWPVNGAQATNSTTPDGGGPLALDGAGGVFLAFQEGSYLVAVQHLDPTGAVAPGWPAAGIRIDSPAAVDATLLLDGTGGFFVAWTDFRRGGLYRDSTFDVYATHFTAAGTIAPGWPAGGVLLVPRRLKPQLLPDGAGGFFMVYTMNSDCCGFDSRYYVQHFRSDGTADSAWPADGLLVCGAPGDKANPQATLDRTGGIIMTWYDYRSGGSDVYVARVTANGMLAPGWPANGLRITDPTQPNEFDDAIVADGLGGAYVLYETETSEGFPAYVHHITGNATVAAGWPAYGVRLASTCCHYYPTMVTDGAGGAIAVWGESRGATGTRAGLFAQRFVMDGVVATQISLVSSDPTPDHVTLTWQSAAAQGLVATVYRRTEASGWQSLGSPALQAPDQLQFTDRSVTPGTRYDYRLGYSEGGAEQFTTETWVDVPRPATLALDGLRPNPASGALTVSFSLPDAASASLEALDVSGRRVAQREVGSLGAGQHLIRLAEASTLEPGIYWLRLRHGDRTLLSRGAVIR